MVEGCEERERGVCYRGAIGLRAEVVISAVVVEAAGGSGGGGKGLGV